MGRTANEEQKKEKVVEPAIKKRKLMKTEPVKKRIMSPPKVSPPKNLNSSQEIFKLVGKIEKKKSGDIMSPRINKILKKDPHKTAIIQSKKKLAQHSTSLLLKSSMIKVKTSKHCKDKPVKEKEKKKVTMVKKETKPLVTPKVIPTPSPKVKAMEKVQITEVKKE